MKRVFVKAIVGDQAVGVQTVYLPPEKMAELRARGYESMNAYALYKAEAVPGEGGSPKPNAVRFSVDVADTWVLFGERPEDVG